MESFTTSVLLPAAPDRVFNDWMSDEGHTWMTGGEAVIDARVGGSFSAWDGYIEGKTLAITPGKMVRQSWRTSEWHKEEPDSFIEVSFAREGDGTRLTLTHTEIPDRLAGRYEPGWKDHYFEPMMAWYKKGGSRW